VDRCHAIDLGSHSYGSPGPATDVPAVRRRRACNFSLTPFPPGANLD
jgi:hypothetical protein